MTVASVTVAGNQEVPASLGVTVDEVIDAEEPLTAHGIEDTQGANATVVSEVGPPPIEGNDPPQDLDGDERYEDIDGNGELSIADVQALFLQFVEDDETASASLGVKDPTEPSPEELAAVLADG